jgi:hypothetical protein
MPEAARRAAPEGKQWSIVDFSLRTGIMQQELRERINQFSNEYLLEQYAHNKHEYTEEALSVMKEVIASRGLTSEDMAGAAQGSPEAPFGPVRYSREDFAPYPHSFSHTDLLLAQAVLRENAIPFYVDIPTSSTALPLEAEASRRFTIHVLKDRIHDAEEALGEHFQVAEEGLVRKHDTTKDRLRSFNFHEAPFSEKEMEEEVEVSFEPHEQALISRYVERLLNEADEVEKQRERVLFYYDSLEELKNLLADSSGQYSYTRADLFAILEVLQLYCDEEGFPLELEHVAEGILNFLNT